MPLKSRQFHVAGLFLPVLLWWALLFGWHSVITGQFLFIQLQLSYGIGYAVLALLLLRLFAHRRVSPYPQLWRLLMLVGAAGAAMAELLLHRPVMGDTVLSLWAAAVIGASLASMLTRRLRGKPAQWIYGEGYKA